jgi:hypothetical protein
MPLIPADRDGDTLAAPRRDPGWPPLADEELMKS